MRLEAPSDHVDGSDARREGEWWGGVKQDRLLKRVKKRRKKEESPGKAFITAWSFLLGQVSVPAAAISRGKRIYASTNRISSENLPFINTLYSQSKILPAPGAYFDP